ncbi:MAG: hypothetical protein GF364_08430, partial [Candidatus Lokiarchaeota archaeon]|nr:hypothetical protein [Candidatus Lokiarchaeota archaeon]
MSEAKLQELLINFRNSLDARSFPKIYVYLKQFFQKLSDLGEKKSIIEDFLAVISDNFDLIVEPEREKRTQMRLILQKSINRTFEDSNIDHQKNDFMKRKIVNIIESNISLIESLFF